MAQTYFVRISAQRIAAAEALQLRAGGLPWVRAPRARAVPGDPTTFRAHEMSWVLPSITMFLMKHINEYNFLLTRELLNEYGEH